ncbi:MAG: hypothetical protein LQ351_004949 [Letrouitia transgressa]|nr:MAG: hypothetical protein LQ351_004949 [Letrouitia transgressa]
MPHSDELNANGFAEPKLEKVNPKLVLCFDGTGNQYSANTSDTNIVKLYQKFDREVPNQYHYYQPRMIATVGLLSKGNEELVPFAYRTYQEYEMGTRFKSAQEAEDYMQNFKTTFCRSKVKVHFLGLFDTVNSVGYFDAPFSKKKYLPSVLETARHVRHAVAIDERRCKFKAALLTQDAKYANSEDEDIKEVFFPGNHGDIGGGWMAEGGKARLEADDPLQLSDIALEWMISELDALPAVHITDQIVWNEHRDIFLKNFHGKVKTAVQAPIHDILAFGGGVSRTSTFMWRIMGMYFTY